MATTVIGECIGQQQAAAKVVAQTETRLRELATQLDRPNSLPIYIVQFVDADHVLVYGINSLFDAVLARLGIRNAWKGQVNSWGYSVVGVETLTIGPEAWLVCVPPIPPDAGETIANNPIWSESLFVRHDRVITIPVVYPFGGILSGLRLANAIVNELTRRSEAP
jgi:iron complex transport system substrate-binding protein